MYTFNASPLATLRGLLRLCEASGDFARPPAVSSLEDLNNPLENTLDEST